MTAFLEVIELSKAFGGITAVDACSFGVERGTVTGLIGPNGAGKTTVFNLISGLLPADSGTIVFDGSALNGLEPHRIARKGLSRTFQLSRELKEMSVLENMAIQIQAKSVLTLFKPSILAEEREKAMALLEFVGIAHLAQEKAKNLSYGQKKLLDLAAVLMADPSLILLDEPAGGVNPKLLEHIMEHIETVNRRGMTFLIVEHNMEMVMNLCDPIIVMAHGKVLARGSRDSIQNDEKVLDAYLGEA